MTLSVVHRTVGAVVTLAAFGMFLTLDATPASSADWNNVRDRLFDIYSQYNDEDPDDPNEDFRGVAPSFRVEPGWPKPLPNNWVLGQVAGIAVDVNDHIWVLNRPRSMTNDEAWATDALEDTFVCNAGGMLVAEGTECADGDDFPTAVPADAFGNPRPNGPEADCCVPAPAVLKFDQAGNLLDTWGGPVQRDPDWNWGEPNCRPEDGCQWPANEHGLHVDPNLNVYIGGNGNGNGSLGDGLNDRGADGQILKFSADGTFLLQVGEAGATMADSNDADGGVNGTPQLYLPADSEFYNGKLYIADGYGNHRVIVVDAATGQYIAHWGAYGQIPVDDAAANAQGPYAEDRDDVLDGVDTPAHFRNPVHCVRVTGDGKVYVCDRVNNRIQVFDQTAGTAPCQNPNKLDGQCGFLEEKFIRADTLGPGSVWDLDTSADRDQSCLHNVDGTNQHLDTILRAKLAVLKTQQRNGRNAGDFHWVHNVAVDSRGNIYTAEVDTGKRAQKFKRVGPRGCREFGRGRED